MLCACLCMPSVMQQLFGRAFHSLQDEGDAFDPDAVALSDTLSLPVDSLSLLADSLSLPADSLALFSDSLSLPVDSLAADSLSKKKGMLDYPVTYEAKDSIVITAGNFALLFGEGKVVYDKIELEAENIEMDMDNSTVFAKFGLDTLGGEFGYPLFKEGEAKYDSKTMRYNFKSKKGYITDVITEQGEGYLTAVETKKLENDDMFIRSGRYTTCDQHDCPHFYVQLTKAKVRPGKNVVSGPAYLVVEDVPLPLAVPFGFFPFNSTYSSGVIMPSFGDELARGFFIRNGGYYFAINDYIDLALTGEFYTKMSWGAQARSRYTKRYKFSGDVDVNYIVTKLGDKGMPDFSETKDFRTIWTHSQDPKSNPFSTLSASVNFATSGYDRKSVSSMHTNASTQNTKGSTINYTQRFANSPISLSATFGVNQTASDSTLSLNLPNLTFSLPRTYPFRRKKKVGKQLWYEKIQFSYSGSLQNRYKGKQDQVFKANVLKSKEWSNGMQHRIPVSATYTLFRYLNVTPNFNYNERWYTSKTSQSYNYMDQAMQRDTSFGFHRVYDYNAALDFETKMYGFFKPLFGKKVAMIRHVFTPRLSVGYAPGFGSARYGFYGSYTDVAQQRANTYSHFEGGLFGNAPQNMRGDLSFGIKNNIEAKVASKKDSTGFRIVSLVDDLGANMSYNMAADSFQWSNLTGNIRLKLAKNYSLNLSGTFDPYTYQVVNDAPLRVSTPRWKAGKGFARLINTGTSFSYTFDNDTWGKWFGKDKDKKKTAVDSLDELDDDEDRSPFDDDMDFGRDEFDRTRKNEKKKSADSGGRLRDAKQETGEVDSDGYVKNTIKWSLTFNYNVTLAQVGDRNRFNYETLEFPREFRHTFDFSGRLTPIKSWNFNFTSGYDFQAKKIANLLVSISKDLHCFQIEASLRPIGYPASYLITLRATSSMLADLLKHKKQNTGYTNGNPDWY